MTSMLTSTGASAVSDAVNTTVSVTSRLLLASTSSSDIKAFQQQHERISHSQHLIYYEYDKTDCG